MAQTVDDWRFAGRWWNGEVRRDYFLVELASGVVIELYREGEQWCVTRVSD